MKTVEEIVRLANLNGNSRETLNRVKVEAVEIEVQGRKIMTTEIVESPCLMSSCESKAALVRQEIANATAVSLKGKSSKI